MNFPPTKYMGSKRALLPFILASISYLRFDRILDAFSGSGCVAYELKRLGYAVHTNDFLRFPFHVARATVENNGTLLDSEDLVFLLRRNRNTAHFIQETFRALYFSETDNAFLDNLCTNIGRLRSPLKRSLALAAVCRAAMRKRPRGIFTFTGRRGWDGRADLRLSMEQQFLRAVGELNAAVFSNCRANLSFRKDVFDVEPQGYGAVYLDPPYISRHSDCDYTRRYHFLEGLCTYWKGVELLPNTKTKKIRSYPTDFARKSAASQTFRSLFNHFKDSTLIVSYSSNGLPARDEMIELLLSVKRTVNVYEYGHRYSHGNQRHKVGNNNNSVTEYLFIGR